MVGFLAAGGFRAPAMACTGDCDGNGMVSVDELVLGVNISLATALLADCPSLDRDHNHVVSVDELVSAVNSALNGCVAEPTPTVTDTPTVTPTPSSTPINSPPEIPSAEVYRTYPGYEIDLPLPAHDPEGGALSFAATDLPDGAQLDPTTGVVMWTPRADQIGPFVVPFTATDHGVPPKAADGMQSFVVSPLDQCTVPTCFPATGCDVHLAALSSNCCAAGPGTPVDEPPLDCPGGRVVHTGRNQNSGFGRLVNCQELRVATGAQGGGVLSLNVEARCLDASQPVKITLRLETVGLLVVDQVAPFQIALDPFDGYARWNVRFSVGAAPPPNTEGNLTLSITDSDGTKLTEQLRLVLTPDSLPDLPD